MAQRQPESELVFLTGATGFIGSSILACLLESGYRVRMAVRSVQRVQQLFAAQPRLLSFYYQGRLKWCIVPDMEVTGAFMHALHDATYIIHAAGPVPVRRTAIPPKYHGAQFIRPAALGALNLLTAAYRTPTVSRVVITSSIAALMPFDELEGKRMRDPQHPITVRDRTPYRSPPHNDSFGEYAASKVGMLRETERWFRVTKPDFDYVYIHPGVVLGPYRGASPKVNHRIKNSAVLASLMAVPVGPVPGFTAHIDDVAKAHVNALYYLVEGRRGYIIGQPARWEDANLVARTNWPRRGFTEASGATTVPLHIDTEHSPELLCMKLTGFERQVMSVVEQWVLNHQPPMEPAQQKATVLPEVPEWLRDDESDHPTSEPEPPVTPMTDVGYLF